MKIVSAYFSGNDLQDQQQITDLIQSLDNFK
jgi:hypothetical protein